MAYGRWAKQFGAVYKVRLGERDVVVINTIGAARDLLVDQGTVFVSRPVFHAFHKVISSTAGMSIGSSPWDDSCRRRRTAVTTALKRSKVQTYLLIIDRETLTLVEDLIRFQGQAINPDRLMFRFALNVALGVNYGSRIGGGLDNQLLAEIIEVEDAITNVRSTNGQWSDYVPLLRRLPKLPRLSNAAQPPQHANLRHRRDIYMGALLSDLRMRIAQGTDVPCIISNILRDPQAVLDKGEVISICLSIISSGLDTLAKILLWSIGFLAQHPEIQATAYAALVEAHAGNVPPSEDDRVDYIRALAKECMRYFTILKLSLPRETMGEAKWNGITIPSGTTVFTNAWSIHHDAEHYEAPHEFRPERYMSDEADEHNMPSNSHTSSKSRSEPHVGFGLGRRACAGSYLADREMYLALSKLIFFFRIEQSSHAEERDFDIDPATATANPFGLGSMPLAYKVRFVPRNEELISAYTALEKERAALAATLSS